MENYKLEPWRKCAKQGSNSSTFEIFDGQGDYVCDVFNKKDARLIAAAPELLETLRGILAHARNAVESDGDAFIDEVHIVNVCETAIAKATSEK